MLEYLKPVSKKHSISKVKASIILPQSIIRPDEIFNELKGNPNFAKYQKKALKRIKTIGINFQSDKFDNTIGEDIIDGFILEEYNDDGLLINFLTVQNEQNRASITFESKVYTTWNNFFSRFKEDLQHMSAIIKIYIQVINLIYIDEFIWMHQTDVPVRKIFNADSDLINKTQAQLRH